MATSTMFGIGVEVRRVGQPHARVPAGRRVTRRRIGPGRGRGGQPHQGEERGRQNHQALPGRMTGAEHIATWAPITVLNCNRRCHLIRGRPRRARPRRVTTAAPTICPEICVRAVGGGGRPRVVGPGVLGVASAQFLADFRVGPLPEAPQVPGRLHRPAVGSEQAEGHGHGARAERGRVGQTEQLLQLHRRGDRAVVGVASAGPTGRWARAGRPGPAASRRRRTSKGRCAPRSRSSTRAVRPAPRAPTSAGRSTSRPGEAQPAQQLRVRVPRAPAPATRRQSARRPISGSTATGVSLRTSVS